MGKEFSTVLLLSSKDRKGLVSRLSNFVFERGGNILDLDEHVDTIAWYQNNSFV